MQLELNRRSKVPMYRQLAAELREQIVSGAMAEGYRLPPERELSSRLEVNRTTVLQAYQQLKDEGLIASKVGKGTFVLPPASASRTSHTSNSDFGNAITRTTRSSAEMGTSQAFSSGDVERDTSTDFLTTDQGGSSAVVHTIRESRSVQGPEPTVVRPPWSVLFSDYSNRFTYHDIASAERAQRGDTIIDFAKPGGYPGRSAAQGEHRGFRIAGIRRPTGITYRGIRRVACAACRTYARTRRTVRRPQRDGALRLRAGH